MTWNESNHLATWYLAPIGGPLSSSNINFGATNVVGNSTNVTLGNRQNDGLTFSNAFRIPGNGALDQIAFWNRELTNTEVNAQFNTLNAMFQGPAKVFDLSRWNILLPVDNTNGLNTNNLALEINTGWLNSGFRYLDPADWKQKYFYLSTANTMVFEAPWNGARSSGGSGARSELRGTLADGSKDNWTLAGTNTLEATCAVHSAGTSNAQKVIIGQIHEDAPSSGVAAFTVNYNYPALNQVSATVKYHPDGSGSPSDQNYLLATNVNLGTPINYKLQLETAGTNVTLRAVGTVSGVTMSNVVNMISDSSYSGWNNTNVTLYFKAGSYYPNNPTSGTANVTFSRISATHQ